MINENKLVDLLNQKIKNFKAQNIHVYIVNDKVIKSINSSTSDGFTSTYFNNLNGEFIEAYILVDEKLNPELKLRVLYHEIGHVFYSRKLGGIEINNIKFTKGDLQWTISDEFEAFKNQLFEIKKLSELENDPHFLGRQLDDLISRSQRDPTPYKEAIEKLFQDKLWTESYNSFTSRI